MKVSYNWLNDYVAFSLSPEELAQALTSRGVVVETITSANPGVEGVVVGRVVEMAHHPNADTLWVCQVEVGGGKVLQILTGAQNVTTGALVPAAIPGSKLPGMQMAVKQLRGLESNGMLCSAAELGAGEDADGIMILPADPDLVPGQDVADLLGLNDWILELDLTANYAAHCQSMVGVAQEVAAILGTSPDMPDTYTEDQPNTDIRRLIGIDIQEPALCDRYVARVVKGVTVGPSPLWLQARVRAAGMRPINNIVDISNFVMLELGQPLHTFDYRKIRGQQIIVRRAEAGERFVTLDEQARTLDPDVLVIADAEGPIALAGVMGGMESEVTDGTTDILIESAHFDNINNRRTALRYNLPSEAARRFTKGVDPNGAVTAADRAAQLIAMLAGGRIVRGHVDVYPDPTVPPVILMRPDKVNAHLGLELTPERMAEHLSNLGFIVLAADDLAATAAAGKPEPEEEEGADLGGRPVWAAVHQVSPVPTEGTSYDGWADVAWAAVDAASDRLEAQTVGEQVQVVVVPTRRLDVHEEIDLVEEVARSEGYDQIPATLPVLEASRGGRSPLAEQVLSARRALAAAGLDEVMTQSLTHPRVYDKLRLAADSLERRYLSLANPLYEDRSTLRTTILPGLLDTLQYNINRQNRDLGVFEIAAVYRPREGEALPAEPRMLGLAMMGNQAPVAWNSPAEPTDYYSLVGVVANLMDALNIADWHVEGTSEHPALHPGRQAQLWVGGLPAGTLGELHPAVREAWDLPGRVYVGELDFERLADAALWQLEYGAVPRFPAVTRDVALVIDRDSPAARVAETIRGAGGELVEDVTLFDLYEGEHVKPGQRSLAYRITYRAGDRTLAEAEIEAVHGRVRSGLQGLGAELRS